MSKPRVTTDHPVYASGTALGAVISMGPVPYQRVGTGRLESEVRP